jgi:putative tryptophan/tyrosine transport system substrate-binding protein
MRRRDFIALIGGAAAAWPLVAHAQQTPMPVIGFLNIASPEPFAHLVAAFRQGLNEATYVEGQNVAIEYRWAEGQYDRLPGLAADLVRHQVKVIVATGGEPPAMAAKQATQTIPIVFVVGDDPVALGLVDSFNRPGRNATGMAMLAYAASTKRWDLLTELVPSGAPIAVLAKPDSLSSQLELEELGPLWGSRGHPPNILNASNEDEIDAAFVRLVELRAGALFVTTEALWTNRRDQIIGLAARHAVPAIYPFREFVAAGGLMSYGFNLADTYRQVGIYAGRILKGEKPRDLPVQQPTKFDFVINLKAAKALGREIPPKLLAFADEVIE